jgi:hypothetical protein
VRSTKAVHLPRCSFLDAFSLETSKFCRKKCLFLICFLHQQYLQPGALFDPKWRYLLVKRALFLCAVRQGSTHTAHRFSGRFFSGNIEVLPGKMSVSDMFSASTIHSTRCAFRSEMAVFARKKSSFSVCGPPRQYTYRAAVFWMLFLWKHRSFAGKNVCF